MSQFLSNSRCLSCKLLHKPAVVSVLTETNTKSVPFSGFNVRSLIHKNNYTGERLFSNNHTSTIWKKGCLFSNPINLRNTKFKCFTLGLAHLNQRFYAMTISRSLISQKDEDVMNVFDRKAKQLQRNRTALLDNYEVYDYLKEEIGWRMADRIEDIKRKFDVVVELGCGRGHISKHVTNEMAGIWYQCDMADKILAQSSISSEVPTYRLNVDEEFLPFPDNSVDMFISSLSLHWVNNLPGTFRQIHSALKNDGVFIGAMFGGDTLHQLRVALQLAETELEGGISSHISPFTDVRDLGNLLTRANYNMITMDIDEMTVNFPSMFELMKDLKGMGENNCSWNRRSILPRKTQEAAAVKYKEMYGNEDGSIPATFQIIYMIGWKPDPSQAKAAERGSGEVSIKDLDKLNQLVKEMRDDTNKDKPS